MALFWTFYFCVFNIKNKIAFIYENDGFDKVKEIIQEVEKKANSSNDDKITLQSTLLTQLDNNDDTIINLAGYSFVLVNIARVDNVPFATKIFMRLLTYLLDNCRNFYTVWNYHLLSS